MRAAARRPRPVRLAHALLVVALAAAAAPAPLRAQRVDLAATSYTLHRRLGYHDGVYDQNGPAYGGAGSVQLGRFRLSASGWTARLAAADGAPNGDAQVRTTAVALHVQVSSALLLGYRVENRRFASDAGVSLWQLRGPDILLEPDLGLTGLTGVAEVNLLSAGAVRDGPPMDVALQTTMGVTYTPPRSRFHARVAYRFERYDIAADANDALRLEQFRGLIVELGYGAGR